MGRQDSGNGPCDLILNREYVLSLPIVAFRPAVPAGHRIDELSRDPDAIAITPNAAFKNVVYPALASGLPAVHRFALVLEAGVACDHEQLGESRQLRNDVFRDAIREVVLPGVAAHIGEGQDRNGRFLRERQRRSRLVDRRRSGWRAHVAVVLAHSANEAEAFALERLDQMLLLSAVANRAAGHVQARRYRRVGDDAAVPDGRDQIILADDVLSVTDQIQEKVEDFRRNGDHRSAAPQLAAVGVELIVFKEIAQACVPTWPD